MKNILLCTGGKRVINEVAGLSVATGVIKYVGR